MRLGLGQGAIVSSRALGVPLMDPGPPREGSVPPRGPYSHLGALVRLGFGQGAIVSPRALGVPLEDPSPIWEP